MSDVRIKDFSSNLEMDFYCTLIKSHRDEVKDSLLLKVNMAHKQYSGKEIQDICSGAQRSDTNTSQMLFQITTALYNLRKQLSSHQALTRAPPKQTSAF